MHVYKFVRFEMKLPPLRSRTFVCGTKYAAIQTAVAAARFIFREDIQFNGHRTFIVIRLTDSDWGCWFAPPNGCDDPQSRSHVELGRPLCHASFAFRFPAPVSLPFQFSAIPLLATTATEGGSGKKESAKSRIKLEFGLFWSIQSQRAAAAALPLESFRSQHLKFAATWSVFSFSAVLWSQD